MSGLSPRAGCANDAAAAPSAQRLQPPRDWVTRMDACEPITLLEDVTSVEEDSPREQWAIMIAAMRSGRTAMVSESVAWYFLEVLPPRWMPGTGAFAFCEGDDQYTVFVAVNGQWLMRTLEYGERAPADLDSRTREMIAEYARHCARIPAE